MSPDHTVRNRLSITIASRGIGEVQPSRRRTRSNCLIFLLLGSLVLSWTFQPTSVASAASPLTPQDAQPHLYFFTNDGCAPCRQVEPGIEALQQEGYPVTTLKLNDNLRIGQQLQVDRTPTVVLLVGNKMVGRHAGLIDAVTLKKWFAAVGMPQGANFSNVDLRGRENDGPIGTKVTIDRSVTNGSERAQFVPENFSTPTMHRGVARPDSDAERRAMLATVRLKVEDTQGISYATGTVIHTHGNESLVITCGHVFRDSAGKGVITAEYNFYTDPERASGRLIDFDAGPRDIALVAIRTQTPIQPVKLAPSFANVQPGLDIFSIGCDKGNDPTIRRSRIKNRASYDGAIKYDIFGRPVDGRSGGGLFSPDGQLLGVCNAAAVEVDEGIYTALETIHWELANTGLDHLFDPNERMAALTSTNEERRAPQPERYADSRYQEPGFQGAGMRPSRMPVDQGQQTLARSDRMVRLQDGSSSMPRRESRPTVDLEMTRNQPGPMVNKNIGNDKEVVILVRSKSNPRESQAIQINDPTPELLQYLNRMK